jgi:hypothetical protein
MLILTTYITYALVATTALAADLEFKKSFDGASCIFPGRTRFGNRGQCHGLSNTDGGLRIVKLGLRCDGGLSYLVPYQRAARKSNLISTLTCPIRVYSQDIPGEQL